MIFQTELTSLDSELSQLEALLNAKRQQRHVYNQLQQQTEGYLEGLAKLKQQISEAVGTNALASLKSAVLGLFGTDDDGTDGGNQPSDPSPQPIEPLSGQTCQIDKELEFYWQRNALPEGQSWEFATPIACLLWEDAPLLGQACTVEYPQPEEKPTYTEFVKVSDRIGYIKVNTTGEIIATYAGFNNKSRAKTWANYLEAMTARIELRAAKRLGDWKHELKISGLSIKQVERLAAENLDKTPPDKEPSLPPTYKPQPTSQPVNPDEVEEGDIVTALLTPSASYRVEQVMPNGILDCTNLTTGDRLGLRPSAVSLVQKAEKPQDPEQQALKTEPNPDTPIKYARVKLKGDKFDGQVFTVVKDDDLGSTLATTQGNHWFRADCLEFIDPDAQTTAGNYKGLSKQIRQHWEKVGVNPFDLIADMKADRPTEPEWNAAKYNPVLASVGAGDDLDF